MTNIIQAHCIKFETLMELIKNLNQSLAME